MARDHDFLGIGMHPTWGDSLELKQVQAAFQGLEGDQ